MNASKETTDSFVFAPIGYVRSPYEDRLSAPRQSVVGAGTRARIELCDGFHFEDALTDLESFDHIWVVFVFHRNVEDARGYRPKVSPPRSTKKRGLFATRSPHRPNPIGISAVRLEKIEGRVLHIESVDMLDGTPVLDIKPYVAYADAYPEARPGWLEEPAATAAAKDSNETFVVEWSKRANDQLDWILERGFDLRSAARAVLALGPQPHAYRRIRREGDRFVLAHKEWRIRFAVENRTVVVESVSSGYRPKDLATGTEAVHALHRAFVAQFSLK